MSARTFSMTFLALLAGCGSAYGTTVPDSGPPAQTATVNATPGLAFNPSPANVLPGGTVTFAFGTVAHNVFFDATPGAPADIPGNNSGTNVARTFTTEGTYNYNCHIHPGMHGTVVVGTASVPSNGGYYYP